MYAHVTLILVKTKARVLSLSHYLEFFALPTITDAIAVEIFILFFVNKSFLQLDFHKRFQSVKIFFDTKKKIKMADSDSDFDSQPAASSSSSRGPAKRRKRQNVPEERITEAFKNKPTAKSVTIDGVRYWKRHRDMDESELKAARERDR